jgi:3-phenylpropionate/trans-cinnamate dioxygenase ferredoxin reductase subunit
MADPFILIGAGQSAAQAVASLREEGYDREILLFGEEPFLPYQRPPLSKAFLAGETTAERLELRPARFYQDRSVELRLGEAVISIDPSARRVTTAKGREHAYSRLLIATGTRPRPLPVPGDGLAGVHHIRAIRDVERFRAEFQPGRRLVIIGGGYIGLEVAAKSRRLGLDVTVVEAAPRCLARVVADVTAHALVSLHREQGVTILEGQGVVGFAGEERVTGVTLRSGATLPAEIVLVAIGAVPNVELARNAGITTADGIVVDAACCTNVPEIYASGDVCMFPSVLYGRSLRLESVQNAIDQAKVAARAMLGLDAHYNPVPWFWSDQYEAKLQIAGLSQGHDRVEIEGEPGSLRFSVRYFAADRLIAVDSLNDPRSHMLARRAIAGHSSREAA